MATLTLSKATYLSPSGSIQPAARFDYLDGLRGAAALYVVLYHVYLELALSGEWNRLPAFVRYSAGWLQFCHVSVGVFIVLSGFCLMLPVARSSDRQLPGGLGQYFVRRARRILPPYYAA